nr:immunoglobulin heavy chain junction region [Mus musculus]
CARNEGDDYFWFAYW